jgi:ADP-ribosyl-[dinitrogen reductase] hydrolase
MMTDPPPGTLTSDLRVAWIDGASVPTGAGWSGSLGMTFLPGKRDHGISGHHWRDLDVDVQRLRDVHRADAFVLLVEDHELRATSTTAITATMERAGIRLIRFRIIDGGVPLDAVVFRLQLDDVSARLRAGERVVVACRGGLGRTGTLVACLLIEAGLDAEAAIDLTRRTRPMTIENATQEAFIRAWR